MPPVLTGRMPRASPASHSAVKALSPTWMLAPGAVVFGDLGIDFNKRTVAGVRGGVRFVELVAAGQRCEGRCTEEEFEGFFHGAEVLGFVGFVHVTVVIGHRKNTPAYR